MEIHIGKVIKEKVNESQLSVIKFAFIINTTRENVYGIFKRKSIDTELLIKISKALNYNFFETIFEAMNSELNSNNKISNNANQNVNSGNEFEYIKRENVLLKDVIRLLKDKYEK